MAITKKTLFADNLDKYNTFVTDTDPLSKYFKLTELPDTFTGGKNAFLIQGSEYLVADSLIKIELKDAKGDVIYHEPGEGIISASVGGEPITTEYYEGVSKLVSVYIYPDTAYGPCTLTILGELSSYDNNGTYIPIPANWEGSYNVKWQKQINVVPSLANNTKIRFYKRPTVKISEILSPIYKIENDLKVASAVTQSFANIKLSNLETFAGDVKRVKVFRTSIGDISDYDLIQDILVESKELLISYGLSGSVVGNTGIFTSEVLKNQWNSGSLTAILDSSRVEAGVRLTGNGNFRYTQSLDLSSANTYELNLDAFYSSSTNSNLGIYLVSGSTSSSIATLSGTQPTKNLLDTTIPFKVDRDYPTASLYFSQSQGQWHLGNVSLKLSEDTAFSPDEIGFITTMPTVLGNETFNFKFEFYDVNNNYVPVEVTQSALFNGGNTNIGGTILLISSSASSSLADLNRVSSSISGTVTFTSSSISGTLGTVSSSVSGSIYSLSGSVSGTIGVLSGSVSQSVALTLSSSLSKVQQLADGTFGYTGTFIDGTTVFAPVIGGTNGYISKLFTVGDTTAARINLDARNIADGAPDNLRRIWIGSGTYGTYNSTNTNVYLDSAGKFSLGNKLSWSGTALSLTGEVIITSGTTKDAIDTANTNATNASNAVATVDAKVFTDSSGKLSKTPSLTSSGLFLGSQYLGYYDGGAWKTYMSNTGNFFLTGTGNNGLSWNGTTLSITGEIVITSGTTKTAIDNAASAASTAQTTADSKITGGQVNANVTSISGGAIQTGTVAANRIDVAGVIAAGSIIVAGNNISSLTNNSGYQANGDSKTGGFVGGWAIDANSIRGNSPTGGGDAAFTDNTGIILSSAGWISSKNFYISSAGNAAFRGNITATGGSFSGPVTAGNVTIKSDGIKVSGDTGGIELDGGRGIFSDNGGRISLTGAGSFFFCNNGINSTGVYPGVISINNYNVGGTTLQISNYGGSSTIFSVGSDTSDGVYIEDTSFEFRKASAQTYLNWRAVFLEPVSTGTVSMQVDGSGYIKKASSSRRFKKNIEDTTLDEANRILNLNVRSFNGLNQEDGDDKAIGLVAEEVQDLGYDDLVVMGESGSVESVYYQSVFASMIKVVQNLNSRVEELEARLSGSV
jgi:hypothetical protein